MNTINTGKVLNELNTRISCSYRIGSVVATFACRKNQAGSKSEKEIEIFFHIDLFLKFCGEEPITQRNGRLP